MRFPLVSNAYEGMSSAFESSRTINLYPDLATDANSKDIISLVGTPGLKYLGNLVGYPIRALYSFNNELFAVAGADFVTVDTDWTVKDYLGSLGSMTSRVVIRDNGLTASSLGGNQILIVDGTSGYIFDIATRELSVVPTDGSFPTNPTYVEYLDGYFIAINASMRFGVSDLFDGLTWNGLATANTMGTSRENRAVLTNYQMLFFIKEDSIELWQNAAIPTSQGSPFQKIQGAEINYGTNAPHSWVKCGSNLYGLATSRTTGGTQFYSVVQISGYVPSMISPPAVNYQINKSTDLTQCFGYLYNENGHTFYILTNPVDNWTWAYDVDTTFWHERSSYVDDPYRVNRHIANCYTVHNGKHIVGDDDGNIYEMSSNYKTDAGKPICSVRVLQPIFDKQDLDPFPISSLMIDAETGVGYESSPNAATGNAFVLSGAIDSVVVSDGGADYLNDTPPDVIAVGGEGSGASFTAVMLNGSVQSVTVDNGGSGYTSNPDIVFSGPQVDPYLALSWSNDGGKTWSGEYAKSLGKSGEYGKKLTWWRLGHIRNSKIFRLLCTDACKKFFMGAYIK